MTKFEKFVKEINNFDDKEEIELKEIKAIDEKQKITNPFFYQRLFPPRKSLTIKALKYFLNTENTKSNILNKYFKTYTITNDEIKIVFSGKVFMMNTETNITETIIFTRKSETERIIENFLQIHNQNWDGSEKQKQEWIKASKKLITHIAKTLQAKTRGINHIDNPTNRGEIEGYITKDGNWVYVIISDVPAFKNIGILYMQVERFYDKKGFLRTYIKPNYEGIQSMIQDIKKILNKIY